MPHILFNKKNKELVVPSKNNGTNFEFIAKSYNFTNKPRKTEYKICTSREGKKFFLTLKEKEKNLLLKADKVTRVSPVQLIKDAINSYVNEVGANIIFSNTQNFNQKIKPNPQYLRDIDFFINNFKYDKEIYIEIGFGSARHLLHQAKNNPDIQFIGLEIHYPSIEQILKQIKIQNLNNILVVNYDARLFMEFMNSNSVGKIFVHFPVPWDKKPHRRIYSNAFVNEALRVLKLNGTLELRTDSRKYFDYCIELLVNLPSSKITIYVNKNLPISSKYECKWKKQGKNIYDILLTCEQKNKPINFNYKFNFDKEIEFNEIIKNIPTKAFVRDDYFIRIENVYILENKDNSGLLEVTFGSFDKPLNKYILIENKKGRYFQDSPLPISANIKAHNSLKEMLKI